jgi:hypothetical protein
MSRHGIITLPPSRVDLAISRSCARAATPARERSLQVVTWLADDAHTKGLNCFDTSRESGPAIAPR